MLFAEELPTTLVVWAKDGTKVSYALNEQPKITFTEECLLITTTKVEVSYKLAQMARFTYENTDVNAIIDVNGKTVNPFTFNGDVLLFPASDKDCSVNVYSIDGKLVTNCIVRAGNTLSVSLASFTDGVYVIRVNGLTYKVLKR